MNKNTARTTAIKAAFCIALSLVLSLALLGKTAHSAFANESESGHYVYTLHYSEASTSTPLRGTYFSAANDPYQFDPPYPWKRMSVVTVKYINKHMDEILKDTSTDVLCWSTEEDINDPSMGLLSELNEHSNVDARISGLPDQNGDIIPEIVQVYQTAGEVVIPEDLALQAEANPDELFMFPDPLGWNCLNTCGDKGGYITSEWVANPQPTPNPKPTPANPVPNPNPQPEPEPSPNTPVAPIVPVVPEEPAGITKADLSASDFTFETSDTYNKKTQSSDVKSSVAAGKIKVYYNQSTKRPTKAGKYTVSVSCTGSDAYNAAMMLELGTYTIYPHKVSALKVKSGNNKLIVSWKNFSSSKANASSYKVSYKTKGTTWKTKSLKSSSAHKVTLKLRDKKKYTVKVSVVRAGVSSTSATKTAKTK
ncbi:MAG: fibronectin type III domain-containing protein [Coriobacteriales bacterium]|jgi:hypothetical protein|nr:fibronectin type III domain-containing protein [Coriobacteriales bacterium]